MGPNLPPSDRSGWYWDGDRCCCAASHCHEARLAPSVRRSLRLLILTSLTDPRNKPSAFPLPAISLAIVSFRLLVLVLLVLSQTPLFYKSNFVPYAAPGASENTSLLNGAATTYGSDAMDASAKKRSPLRSSKPPSHRPPDPKSLSILTLFTRVYTLFPYLWPSKSLSLQILAMVCVGLMLLKRVVNVWVPILFGRIISDLSAGRRETNRSSFQSLSQLTQLDHQPPTLISSSTPSHLSCRTPTACFTATSGYPSNSTLSGR